MYANIAKRYGLLGLTAFGGPQAHVALILKQPWRAQLIDESTFISLYALTQYMPGPSSTQLVIAMGTLEAGWQGGLLALACWSAPATLAMTAAGTLSRGLTPPPNVQAGLSAAAVALVANAALMISKKCATDKLTRTICIASASIAMLTTNPILFPLLLTAGAIAVFTLNNNAVHVSTTLKQASIQSQIINKKRAGLICGTLWLILLLGLSACVKFKEYQLVSLADIFYRTGSLVYGGGQVVLPFLLRELVEPKYVNEAQFLDGFALVQAMPGPLFNIAAFLGAVAAGPLGALVSWTALFLPGLLLIWTALPFWAQVQESAKASSALRGVNAAAAGLVIAATFILANKAAHTPAQQVIALLAFSATNLFGLHPALTILISGLILGPLILR